jgi:DNA-directed RNA polymerase subunit beta
LERLFFNPKRYSLGDVGRYRINQRLHVTVPLEQTTLDKQDFVAIIRYLLELRQGEGHIDDIDHLGNRRTRTVGELLAKQFSVGLSRMARTVRERMSLRDTDGMTPHDLVNARTVSAVIHSFFGSSQLSQFMDQTNPLAELTHKRRLSALGPGGLTRDRAGFEVRDIHHTHYGRICPIETPEGPNIGLISSLSTYARINDFGFIESPYRKVKKGLVTDEIVYLSADAEDQYTIAQANAPLNPDGTFRLDTVKARRRGDFPIVAPEDIDYMDVIPVQLVGVASALIPFLEHDDAGRALMGSNMQRQAVPLLKAQAPLVGTGIEHRVALDSGAMITAEEDGTVVYVSADRIVVKEKRSDEGYGVLGASDLRTYFLTKFARSNAGTCINQQPRVTVGEHVQKGNLLADGPATDRGELALGANVLVAFMSWKGFNFEDAIIISERLCKNDTYTSIHIEEFEVSVRDTKRGEEEITREIPNVSEEAVRNLDDLGIIRVGAEVHAGTILVGKVTPKGETEPSPEERLLRAIFGEKAGDVRDASLKAPPGTVGVVVDTKVFSRKEREPDAKKADHERIAQLKTQANEQIQRVKRERDRQIFELLKGHKVGVLRNIEDSTVVLSGGQRFDEEAAKWLDLDVMQAEGAWTEDAETNARVEELLDLAERLVEAASEELEQGIEKVTRGDELAPGIMQLVKVYVACKRKLTVGDKMAGRHGNKGVVSKIVPEEDMPYLPDGTPIDIILNPLGVPSRMNLGQLLETHLGWVLGKTGVRVATPVFDGASIEDIKTALRDADLPENGKSILYDGQTGEPFESEVTMGYIYMMKLSHLAMDKIHARSIGPYSLVTQQPLGGKAQFGGQRFGEMEVWALEAYGAAYLLQEMLTVKSDDVAGRSKIYESIVKGESAPEPGTPESFNVLVKELQSLGLDVELGNKE